MTWRKSPRLSPLKLARRRLAEIGMEVAGGAELQRRKAACGTVASAHGGVLVAVMTQSAVTPLRYPRADTQQHATRNRWHCWRPH